MVFGNTPFTFSMQAEPMVVDSVETAEMTRSSDSHPISPNAMRRIYSRRRNAQSSQSSVRRQNMRALGKSGGGEASSAWTTDNDDSTESSDASIRPAPQRRKGRSDSAVTRGVDRVLALMGSQVDEPTVVERLQMHRDIPYVISGYLQLGFNVFMVGTVLLIIVHVLLTIQRDVNSKVQEYSTEILQEIAACSKQYHDNRCEPAFRVPAMERACIAWDNCMHRDPTKIGRAKVSAETLAEIINGFIEPISMKTMLVFVLLFVGTLLVSNFAFGAYRHSRVRQQYVSQSGGRQAANQSARRRIQNDYYLASPTPRHRSLPAGDGSPARASRSRSGSSSRHHPRLAAPTDLYRRRGR
ncbi:hypothetical protein GGI20_004905 [Coemansia sp. BCRC 34301]|nr:hypothetical protein GGI20_004905 [Coemansia sp. BCRC 34301]